MIGYPLDSHVTYKADGTPVFDRAISSAPLRKLTKKLFSDGVLPNPSTNMQVTAVSGATVKVLNGFALCNGCMKLQETDLEIILPTSDASLDRIDTVVLRLDDNDDVRACEFYVVSGAAASTPQAPALTKTDSIYELGLANIYRKANSTEVTNANITDTRYDSARCGIISSISEFDTTTLYQQIETDLREFKTINEAEFEAWFTTLKDVLSGDVAGELYNLINEVKGNVGNLEELKTSNKEDIVSAVNEVKDGLDNAKVDTLTTLEQVEATTDNTIPVGAGAVKQLNNSLGEIIKKYKITKTISTTTYSNIHYYDLDVSGITKNALTDGTSVVSTINNTSYDGATVMYCKIISNTSIRCFFNTAIDNVSITFNIIK
ncbi:MAG: hypothetical protein IKW30_03630 [Lachnospiraceae bacterium]|nr:hypothetical protein [Lachnospiraceae bacterium]